MFAFCASPAAFLLALGPSVQATPVAEQLIEHR
jgi:hypothetical protein